MPTAVPYLSEAQVNECLDPAALIEAMRQVLIDLSAGNPYPGRAQDRRDAR